MLEFTLYLTSSIAQLSFGNVWKWAPRIGEDLADVCLGMKHAEEFPLSRLGSANQLPPLPPQAQRNIYLMTFFDRIHPILPVLDVNSFGMKIQWMASGSYVTGARRHSPSRTCIRSFYPGCGWGSGRYTEIVASNLLAAFWTLFLHCLDAVSGVSSSSRRLECGIEGQEQGRLWLAVSWSSNTHCVLPGSASMQPQQHQLELSMPYFGFEKVGGLVTAWKDKQLWRSVDLLSSVTWIAVRYFHMKLKVDLKRTLLACGLVLRKCRAVCLRSCIPDLPNSRMRQIIWVILEKSIESSSTGQRVRSGKKWGILCDFLCPNRISRVLDLLQSHSASARSFILDLYCNAKSSDVIYLL